MLTIRPTKMLARQLGISVPVAPPAVPSRVADWCAHGFELDGDRWLIFCNTASLYPVFAGASGVDDGESLARRIGGMVPPVLLKNGFSAQGKLFGDELDGFQFAPVPGRSVLGSINELIFLGMAHFEEGSLTTPSALSLRLGRTPMSALGMNHPARGFASLRS